MAPFSLGLNRLSQFGKRPFVRSVAIVAAGTAASQAIAMAFSPLITRLYGPETYGIQGIFMSVAGVMAIIAAMTYPMAIVLPKSDVEAFGLVRLSVFVGITMSLLVTILLYLFGSSILNLLNADEISTFIYLVPVFMLISVISSAVSQWLLRKKAFSLTAKVTILQALLTNSGKTALGTLYPTAIGLIAMNAVGGVVGIVQMLMGQKTAAKAASTELGVSETESRMPQSTLWTLAKHYRDFPMFRAPQGLLNALSQFLPVVTLAAYFGPAAVGFYTIASAVLAMPAGLIGGSVMQVFYPRISDAIRGGEDVKKLIQNATLGLALSGAPPFVVVAIAGPSIFGFVFGNEWETAGAYAQWLSVWLFFQYINKPAVSAIPALGLQKGLLIYEVFSTSGKILALYIGYVVFGSDQIAIALFSVFGVISYVWLIIWVIGVAAKQKPR
jgi:O-antigen/teichoic acid export membrane protein